jgi:nitrogen regulatory protein P-II 1
MRSADEEKELAQETSCNEDLLHRAKESYCRHKGATQLSLGRENTFENDTMTKLEAVIQNSKLESVKNALQEIGVEGMTVSEVRGHGRQKGHTEVYRGREYSVDLIPKTKLEVVLADGMVEKAVQAIVAVARTGKIGDGKIFLSRIDEAIRIRNDERGEGAL